MSGRLRSDVLDGDLLEVVLPVLLEAEFLFALRVELGHDVVHAAAEALLELRVVLVARADDRLVVHRVFHLHLRGQLVRHRVVQGALRRAVGPRNLARASTAVHALHGAVVGELALEVNLEDGLAEAWELARGPLGEVRVGLHGHEVLHVLVLFLDDLVAREHDEVLGVNHRIEQLDERARVVQVDRVEGHGELLLDL